MSLKDRVSKLEKASAPAIKLLTVYEIDGVLYRQDGEQRQVITLEELGELKKEYTVLRVRYDKEAVNGKQKI